MLTLLGDGGSVQEASQNDEWEKEDCLLEKLEPTRK